MKPTRTIAVLTAALTLTALQPAAAQQQEQYPTEPPPPLEATDVSFPAVAQDTLDNGLRLVVVENREQPVVSVRLYLPAGEVADPGGKTGVANLTASVLDKGTESRTAEEIASTVEGVGASINVGAADDYSYVSTTALTKHLGTVMDVFADVVRHPVFPQEEFETEKRRMLSSLEVQLSQPGALASRQFRARVYGEHPYGEEPTPETVETVTREDLAAFHAERYTPRGALMVVAGDLSADEARSMAREAFGDWEKDDAPAPAMPEPPARDSARIYLVHRPGSVQSNIWVGHLGVRPGNEDAHAIDVMNRVLGGGANSRLFLILREEKGWTYGAYSRFTDARDVGYFAARAEVRNPVTDSALNEMIDQLERLRSEPVPDDELADAKNYLTGHFPLEIETPQQVASKVADALQRGLGLDYLESYRSEVSRMDADAVREAAREYVHPDRAAIVVVGDATKIMDGLEGIAPITLLNTDGEEIQPSELEIQRTEVALDASRMRRGTFRYAVTAQGNEVASSTIRVEDTGNGDVRVTEEVSGMISQTTVYVVTPSLEPVSMKQEGQAGQTSASTELSYEDGRVTGTAAVPRQGGEGGRPQIEQVQVDTSLAEGVIDQNMAPAALLSSPLGADYRLKLPVFSPGSGVSQLEASVAGSETVQVPAGSFETWKISLRQGGNQLNLFVTREPPHMLVKQDFVGRPVSLELQSVGSGGADQGGEDTEGGG
mgnify:CR=1 FL=1